jgi:hypothetical protein
MRKILAGLILAVVSWGVAQPPQIGTLYTRDMSGSLNMTCTISVVAGEDYAVLDHDYAHLLLTAAHCVNRGLRYNETIDEWRTNQDFFASFDEKTYYEVNLLRVGRTDVGYDVALLYFVDYTPDIDPLRLGDWDLVDVGTDIINYANPAGLGVQAFRGYISMLSLDRPVEGSDIFWRGNSLSILPSAGGSSGSLVLNSNHEVIGVHIGSITPRNGSQFGVFVPIRKFPAFLTQDTAGITIIY